MQSISDLYELKGKFEQMCKAQEDRRMNTVKSVVEDKQSEINQLYDIVNSLKAQLEEKDRIQENTLDQANDKYSEIKQKLIDLQQDFKILQDANDQLKDELLIKDDTIRKLKKDKEDRAKIHFEEIENIKLQHQQELYMLKMRGKK